MASKNDGFLRDDFLRLSDVSLQYGSVCALRNLTFSVRKSEIHAVVGEHGAGKSTLAMVVNGELQPQSGRVYRSGILLSPYGRKEARTLGIELVHQGSHLIGSYTVAENMYFPDTSVVKGAFHLYSARKLERTAGLFIRSLGFSLNPSLAVKVLNHADQALVSILRALVQRPRLLILDEVLENLSAVHLHRTVEILREMVRTGASVVFITHRIDDIYEIADRVSILRDGELLLTESVRQIDKINLIKIAYTQISRNERKNDVNREFYQLLKYNEAILKNLPINLLVTDNVNRIKLVNTFAMEYFGLKGPPHLELPLSEFFRAEGNENVLEILQHAFSVREKSAYYNVPMVVDHRTIAANIIVYPIIEGKMLLGNILIIEDVTEMERMRQQMVLSEKLASIGLLAAGVAHEINNPLGTIYNYLETLKCLGDEENQRNRLLSELEDQFEYIATIVSSLMSFSDRKAADTETVEVNELILSMISFVRHSAAARQIRIEFDSAERGIMIRSNRNELKQVLLNLFKNSFEAMPDGGVICISTDVGSRNGVPQLELVFQDTGKGIQFENPNDIFLPFNSTKIQNGTNLGLGLSVSYGIIQKYHGEISVRNLRNSGCTFTISLPVL